MVFLICYFSPFMKCIPAFDRKLRRIPKSHFCILQIWLSEMDCHSLLWLLHWRIGKPDQLKPRQPRRHIHLNVDNSSINPEGRRTIGLCKQRSSLLRFKYKKVITQERGQAANDSLRKNSACSVPTTAENFSKNRWFYPCTMTTPFLRILYDTDIFASNHFSLFSSIASQ